MKNESSFGLPLLLYLKESGSTPFASDTTVSAPRIPFFLSIMCLSCVISPRQNLTNNLFQCFLSSFSWKSPLFSVLHNPFQIWNFNKILLLLLNFTPISASSNDPRSYCWGQPTRSPNRFITSFEPWLRNIIRAQLSIFALPPANLEHPSITLRCPFVHFTKRNWARQLQYTRSIFLFTLYKGLHYTVKASVSVKSFYASIEANTSLIVGSLHI